MKKTGLISFTILFVLAGQAVGDWTPWWWPPTGGTKVVPNNPTTSDVAAITLWGGWPDSCVPEASILWVVGNDIYFDVIPDYSPLCLAVISSWELTEYVGPLEPGTYSVYAALVPGGPLSSPLPLQMYTYLTEFTVTDYQFVLSTESLSVPEGGTETFTVALLFEPDETVEVTVACQSGDPDVTVEFGASLTFDPCNYSIPQTVTLAAADDDDYFNGQTIIQVTSPEYLTAEVTATEADNDVPTVLYVDSNAPGANDGTSWANAFTHLKEALNVASQLPNALEIRVAQGVYKPAGPSGDRKATFQLEDIALKGGYAGFGAPNPDVRDIKEYETILSGDLNGNDGPNFANNNDNSEKVVTCRGTVVLDGFTVTAGNFGSGAGMYNYKGTITAINCTFIANSAMYGGAIYNNKGSYLTLTKCIFIDNIASDQGGAIYDNGGKLTLDNCIFSHNAAKNGGAMYNGHYTDLTLANCTFSQNSAANSGGAIHNLSLTDLALTNCILWGNSDSSGTDQSAQIHSGKPVANYCCVQGWTGSILGTGNFDADPCFADPENDDCHLKSQAGRWNPASQTWVEDEVTSPCIDAGDMASPIGLEPFANGGRINLGAYGGTSEASKSYFGARVCQTIIAGDINGDCRIDSLDFAIMAYHWLENNNP